MRELAPGIYEELLDEELQALIESLPELRPVLRSVDEEAAPSTYAQFISNVFKKALRNIPADSHASLVNRVLALLAATDGLEYLKKRRLLASAKPLLLELSKEGEQINRPVTPLATSLLLTGHGKDPALEHELRAEMGSADSVDILVSFIKWSGLRLLASALECLEERDIPVRVLSTSYMGASDPAALEWLAKKRNVTVRLSYDTKGTRMHAKAYLFHRNSGYSTAYIGSANMSHAAMTQGLEWTVKVTAQDLPHILDRFVAEFSSYWESQEFEHYGEEQFNRFRQAIQSHRQPDRQQVFFADITPRPFQSRILEALSAARQAGFRRNLVVAATGTGKTVISALDYRRYSNEVGRRPPLLFVAHRKEILEQALACFRAVLRDPNFGELMVAGNAPGEWRHVFASVQSLNHSKPWKSQGGNYFRFVIVDEAHHGAASSYRAIFTQLEPEILLGLTATPERMDGSSILPDFDDHIVAEIRLPEALEEKLLCPFHYFGVTDTFELNSDDLWKNGKYDQAALDNVLSADTFEAKQRVDNILRALGRYQPEIDEVSGVGFCAGVKHAEYMARSFSSAGIVSEAILGNTPKEIREKTLNQFRKGSVRFLFTVDVLSEGVDVPEINTVLFLRPTDSLTVFLQQLGRGLRHSPGKDCLTVLDFVGQTHRNYRLDGKLAALLSGNRGRLDFEVERDFPSLAPGCSIQLERVARTKILEKIRAVLQNYKVLIPESIRSWSDLSTSPLTFGNFVDITGINPIEALSKRTWSEWKALAASEQTPNDPDLDILRKALPRLALRTDPEILELIEKLGSKGASFQIGESFNEYSENRKLSLFYLLWGGTGPKTGNTSISEALERWSMNLTIARDAAEVAHWRRVNPSVPTKSIDLGFSCSLKLHASYGIAEIKSELGLATFEKPGSTGVGVLHCKSKRLYIHLVTFDKDDAAFSPTTSYEDYPISPTLLHWETQSSASQESPTGQNYIHFDERGYTILFFARVRRKIRGETAPFCYLGPACALQSYQGDRPIQMIWELKYPMPAELYEDARPV